MNLAVHGLEGDIREANTFYEDVHELGSAKCDFVMANPPFNVDMVDAEKVKDDRRLPFGLPGVNKAEEGLQRQLPLDLLLLELPERQRAGPASSCPPRPPAPATARRRCAARSSRPATWT